MNDNLWGAAVGAAIICVVLMVLTSIWQILAGWPIVFIIAWMVLYDNKKNEDKDE